MFLVGCGKNPGGGPSAELSEVTEPLITSSPSMEYTGSLAASSPRKEGSGPEQPQPPQPQQPYVDIARLPIGGNGDGGGIEAAQCVSISLLSELPEGVLEITITGPIKFDPKGYFKTGENGCDDEQSPPCKKFSRQQPRCALPVVQVDDPAADLVVKIIMSGRVTCADKASCADFAKNAPRDQVTVTAYKGLVNPATGKTTSTTTTTKSEPTSTAPTTTEG